MTPAWAMRRTVESPSRAGIMAPGASWCAAILKRLGDWAYARAGMVGGVILGHSVYGTREDVAGLAGDVTQLVEACAKAAVSR